MDFLGKPRNTVLRNISFFSGLLVNLSDARALNNGVNAELVTAFPDMIGHSAIVGIPTQLILRQFGIAANPYATTSASVKPPGNQEHLG